MVPIDYFDASAERRATQPAPIDGETTLTYAEVAAMSVAIAGVVSSLTDDDEPISAVLYSSNDYRVRCRNSVKLLPFRVRVAGLSQAKNNVPPVGRGRKARARTANRDS